MNTSLYLNLAISLVVLALAVFLGWLAVRAWRTRNPFVKWGLGILTSLLTLVVAAVSVLALTGWSKLYLPRTTPATDLKVAGTPQQVERGRYLANALCVECHSKTRELPLSGGVNLAKEVPLPIGVIVPANLTPGGPLKDWSDGEIFRELRTGIDRDGHHLLLMSAFPVRNMSDEDLQAVIAAVRRDSESFRRIDSWLATGDPGPRATWLERWELMGRHFRRLVEWRGEHLGCLQFRKVANWYCKTLRTGTRQPSASP